MIGLQHTSTCHNMHAVRACVYVCVRVCVQDMTVGYIYKLIFTVALSIAIYHSVSWNRIVCDNYNIICNRLSCDLSLNYRLRQSLAEVSILCRIVLIIPYSCPVFPFVL